MLLGRFIVSGGSMEPEFKDGDRLLVSNLIYRFRKPKDGDVIVLKDPRDSRLILKRINKIEDDKYFVLGDNEKRSTDSRLFGGIAAKHIVGKVLFRYRRG